MQIHIGKFAGQDLLLPAVTRVYCIGMARVDNFEEPSHYRHLTPMFPAVKFLNMTVGYAFLLEVICLLIVYALVSGTCCQRIDDS